MGRLTRRSVLRGSAGLVAATGLARPYVANAQAKTATVWWIQGFAQEEDVAFKKIVADYEKASGNKIDYSIIPYAPMRQKIVSAITSGAVPTCSRTARPKSSRCTPGTTSWSTSPTSSRRKRTNITETALLIGRCPTTASRRSAAITWCPYTQASLPNHVWRPLVEKAGYKMEDIPKTWDAYYGFFKDVQKKLRDAGRCATSTASASR